MAYKVSYEADTIPANLPEGAKVERKPVLPLAFQTSYSGRQIEVKRRMFSDGAAVQIHDSASTALDKAEVKRVIEALQEAIHELPPVEVPQAKPEDVKFPKIVTTNISRKFEINKGYGGGAHIITTDTTSYGDAIHASLSKDNARDIAHALLAAIGEPVNAPGPKVGDELPLDEQPPNNVTVIRDGAGDKFYRVNDNPGASHEFAWSLGSLRASAAWSWDEISSDGPVTVVEVR